MKITFRCPGCDRSLKARPDSVGRTRKCPVCATRATCPEPVVGAHGVHEAAWDAEIIEAEGSADPAARPDQLEARGQRPSLIPAAPGGGASGLESVRRRRVTRKGEADSWSSTGWSPAASPRCAAGSTA